MTSPIPDHYEYLFKYEFNLSEVVHMIECSINSLIKYYGANKILKICPFELHSNERVGLIGQKCTRKTTF